MSMEIRIPNRTLAYIIEIMAVMYTPSPAFYEAAGYLSNASSLSSVSSSVKLEVANSYS